MTALERLRGLADSLGVKYFEQEPMSRHTTFRIGGPADLFLEPQNADALEKLCAFCAREGVSIFPLGCGSNLLVSDQGIRGAVMETLGLSGIRIEGETLVCAAGEPLKAACIAARDAGLAGLEFGYGIPGSVGGAVYMNAGAYGGEMKDVVASARHLDGAAFGACSGEELAFGYRKSAYTGTGRIITEVRFALHGGNGEEIAFRMEELMERRRSKQPLDKPSAGSVFKRPPGFFAGTMIEQCGLKGARVGGAMVSEKHAGFIVNAGGATCADVLSLIETVKRRVQEQTGVLLEQEIRLAGEF